MGQQLRVLVAEDEPLIRALVTMAFEAEGYDVDTAADGAEALAKACQQPPQAIVLDLMMPRLDGWAVASLMRQGRLPQVPIVVVTAATDRWGYPAPPNRVLRKPFDLQELLDAVRAVARRSG